MKEKHFQSEQRFYQKAYSDNPTRRERGYGWEFSPSEVVLELFKKYIGENIKERQKNFRVLDVGCGDGRHLAYFAGLGLDTTGIDFSPESIQICRKRFKDCPNIHLRLSDLTKKEAIKKLGQFSLIIEWSVMDHIRREYLPRFKQNILNALAKDGYLISAQLAPPFPGRLPLQKGRDYRIGKGHYVKAYQMKDLIGAFPALQVVDKKENILEDEKNKFLVNTVIFQKVIC